MLLELLEAYQVGKEAGNVIENLYNGDHWDAVNKAYEMAQSLDVNDHYNEGIKEILNQLSVVDNNDRDFVKAAAYELRARCYFDLGDYAKARQNITACLNIQIDSFTLEKDCIREHQKSVRELRAEIDKACAPTPQPYYGNSNDRKHQQRQPKQQKPQQVQNPCTDKLYSRSELLSIISECEHRGDISVSEDSYLTCSRSDIKKRLKGWYNINVSSTQMNSVNTYRGLIDIILSHTVVPVSNSAPLQQNTSLQNQSQAQNTSDDTFYLIIKSTLDNPLGGVRCYVGVHGPKRSFLLPTKIIIEKGTEIVRTLCSNITTSDGRTYNGPLLPDKDYCIEISGITRNELPGGAKVYIASEYEAKHTSVQSSDEKQKSENVSDASSSNEQEYLDEVKECLADGEIGPRERRLLDKLASKLGISPERAAELEASLSAPELTDGEKEYLEEVKAVLADGEISEKERRLLEKLRKMLDISEERAKELESMK